MVIYVIAFNRNYHNLQGGEKNAYTCIFIFDIDIFQLCFKTLCKHFKHKIKILYIKACVENKGQLCASSACISGYVLSDKGQN